MARIEPLAPGEEPEQFSDHFALIEQFAGFVPASFRTMARLPPLLEAFSSLATTVTGLGQVDRELTQLVAHVASRAAGCRYCQAHTATHAAKMGTDPARIADVWEFETSDAFDDAERAALRLARDAAQVPNAVTDDHFAQLAPHFTDEQVLQLVATISLFGFLNRWNDTLATTLEDEPRSFAAQHLGPRGWEVGHHD